MSIEMWHGLLDNHAFPDIKEDSCMPSWRKLANITPMIVIAAACNQPAPQPPAAASTPPAAPMQSVIERGSYIVTAVGGCDDCHTPKRMTPNGPEPDMTRRLAGHPAGDKLAAVPPGVIAPDKWAGLVNGHLTAWAGPWGISFSRNLTPDTATGLGSWTEEMFIKTIRTGKHQGEGRNLLPPMPWSVYKNMTDDDLKATWAFLRSLPAINNAVPDPVPPPQSAAAPISTASQK